MKKLNFVLLIIAALFVSMGVWAQIDVAAAKEAGPSNTGTGGEKTPRPKKILVVYFSHTGTTREIANQIHKIAGGNIFEIQVVEPYQVDYEEAKKRAKQEQESGYKPALKGRVENIRSYDVVVIGYPIWWGTIPAPIRSFLSEYDLSGKSVVPFCTHRGSGLGRSIADISKLCPKSIILDGKAVSARDVKTSQKEVSEWLRKIKIIE